MMMPDPILDMPIDRFIRSTWDVPENAPYEEAVSLLGRSPQQVLAVTAAGSKRLVGIITVSDLSRVRSEKKPTQAIDLATKDRVIAVTTAARVREVIALMNGENSLKRPLDVIPVVNSHEEILGVITRTALEDSLRQLPQSSKQSYLSY